MVAKNGPLLAIVEVRTRGAGSFASALGSITLEKRRRLLAAAERLWSQQRATLPGIERVRIDVATVSFENGETRIEYFEGAVVGASL